MDKTPIYIKMCKKAEKIQNHELQEGDLYSSDGKSVQHWCYEYQEDGTWIPRQDELQAIWVEHSKMKLPECLPEFYYFAKDDVPGQFSTMEQLWLAFVMRELYLKKWDNTAEEWVAYGDKG